MRRPRPTLAIVSLLATCAPAPLAASSGRLVYSLLEELIMGGKRDVSREQLYRELWSEPATIVAKRYGISDVGLTKVCRRYDIPKPGLGYWAKVKHGRD